MSIFKSEKELIKDLKGTTSSSKAMKLRRDSKGRICATGKRKSSVAQVILDFNKKLHIIINGKKLHEYFPELRYAESINKIISNLKTGLFTIKVYGGGRHGQSDATVHGIANVISDISPEMHHKMRREGYLTRDNRIKERRKPGLVKARKPQQFVKR